MELSINGESRQFPDGLNVAGLVSALNLNPTRVAIERNRAIVPRSRYGEITLEAGDAIEIVQFIGGG